MYKFKSPEIRKFRNSESGNPEIRKSGNSEIRKSGNSEIWNFAFCWIREKTRKNWDSLQLNIGSAPEFHQEFLFVFSLIFSSFFLLRIRVGFQTRKNAQEPKNLTRLATNSTRDLSVRLCRFYPLPSPPPLPPSLRPFVPSLRPHYAPEGTIASVHYRCGAIRVYQVAPKLQNEQKLRKRNSRIPTPLRGFTLMEF